MNRPRDHISDDGIRECSLVTRRCLVFLVRIENIFVDGIGLNVSLPAVPVTIVSVLLIQKTMVDCKQFLCLDQFLNYCVLDRYFAYPGQYSHSLQIR